MSWSFRPEPTAQQKALDFAILKRLYPFTQGSRRLIWLSIVLAPLLGAAEVARPYLIKLVVDGPIRLGNVSGLPFYALLFLLLLMVETVFLYVQVMALQYVGQRIIYAIRERLFRQLMRLSRRYLSERPSGVLVTRLTNDLEAVNEFFASGVVTLFSDVIKLFAIAGVMLWMNYRLTMATFVCVPFLWVLGWWFRGRLREAYRSIRLRLARLNGFMAETLGGIETVQTIGANRRFKDRFNRHNEDYRLANMNSIFYDAALYAFVEALGALATGALLWYGGGLADSGTVTFGELVAFIEYITMFFAPIRDLSQKYAVMQSAMASGERVFELLDETVDTELGILQRSDMQSRLQANPDLLQVTLDAVVFGYGDVPVLHGISLHARRGQKIALVGTTGSGKTTTIRLLQRQYTHWSGTIRLAGEPVQDFDLADLRQMIAVVEQSTFLFRGTLAHNLRMYDDNIPDEKLWEVATAVGLLERFSSLDFLLKEGGANLSQGEKQLVALARAVLRDPLVLILDEATSAVDPVLEAHVYQAARQAAEGRILISIAHRLGTVVDADYVYVFRGGRIVEEGDHKSLMASAGYYATLMEYQTILAELTDNPGEGDGSAAEPNSGGEQVSDDASLSS